MLVLFPQKTDAVFDESDAKFKCPGSCGSENLTHREYILGACCKNASKSTDKNSIPKMLYAVSKICEEVGEEEKVAVQNKKEADKKTEELQKELEKVKLDLEKAKEVSKDAHEKATIKTDTRRKAHKRFFFLIQDGMKEYECDFEIAEKKKKTKDASKPEEKEKEDDEKASCKICFGKFGEMHPEAAIYPCGHKACFGCLSSLPQKQCPTCRAPFTQRKILKLYND
ncbi:Oidioi.mRNA.OKI2018_I69.XSR.g14198.t1.cds [Oikopleura dioica]|uniref:Oidioi.mRNA.OKI2018_I69.XSR.g14198.t1.cds n=1 Tax=Oikopleura dioica TaxID=34765 RepID=A0ABN7SHW1_OIKDI|nr:Oidioi.mRNA.OKI2018_I69.XSR.g14198.t1.cds [Oikopleura dioica]